MYSPTLKRILRTGALLAASFAVAPLASAQAQFAGTYIGTINTRVTVPVVGTIESGAGAYIAVVAADGTFTLNNVAVGTVNASGAVTITNQASLGVLGIRSATIANNQLSSNYGDTLGNGTTQFRFNPSSTFTAAPGGGGTGGGGTGGGGTGGGGTGGAGTVGADLLAYYSFNDAANLLRDDSGRGFTLAPVNGTVTRTDGRVGAGALRTAGVRLRSLVNGSFSVSAMTISGYVRPTGPGNWNPRLIAIGYPGQSAHYYGVFLDGTATSRRLVFLGNSQIAAHTYSTGRIDNNVWTHVTVTFEAGTLRFYRDGQLDNTINTGRALTSFGSAMMMIGGSDNGLDLFQGDLDEIRIYNRALTAAEVSTLSGGGSVGGALSTGMNTAAAVTPDVIAAPVNLTGYRSRVGQSFQLSITGTTSGAVWGTDVYTDDSTVAAAAVHAGVVAIGETKTVTVSILPGQASYPASNRNGVSSASWGPWSGSFSFAGSTGTAFTTVAAATAPTLPAGFRAASLNVIPGGRFVIPIPVTGTGPFTYQWFLNGVAIAGATANPYVINTVTAAQGGTYTVRVTSPAGNQLFTAGTLTVPANANAPQIVLQPFDKIVALGGTFALATSAIGSGLTYQWLRNGVAVPAAAGGTNAILFRENADATDQGTYTVRITGGGSTVVSTPAIVTLSANAARLANMSGRIAIGGDATVIPAFTLSGTGRKRVLIRAIGPALGAAPFNLAGVMPDPKFELYAGSTKIQENNDWAPATAAAFTAVSAFPFPANSRDAAGVFELEAGRGYSIHVSSNNGQGGVVMFEVYDVGNVTGASKFTNISVRGPTGTDEATLILGFYVDGDPASKMTLLTRGVGPKLVAFDPNIVPIPDPKVELFDSGQRIIMTNDNWTGADFVGEMLQATDFVGAFALDGGSADAESLALLSPGGYTMQVLAGSGATSGEAIVELYEVP